MNSKSIAIRCMTEKSKGLGNFLRSLELANKLRKKKFKITFFINYNKAIISELKIKRFSYILIPHSVPFTLEHNFLSEHLISKKFSAIIIDMREFGEELSKNLSKKNFKLFLIDDAWCRKAYADIIINGTFIEKYHNYKKINKNCKLFMGSKYLIINEKFQKYKKSNFEIREKNNYNLIISIGGEDPNNLSLKLAQHMVLTKRINVKIIVGPLYKNKFKLRTFVKNHSKFSLISSPKSIWGIFNKADLVISGGGTTLFELANQGIPTLCIPTSKHQIPYIKKFEKKGFGINLGYWKNFNFEQLNKKINQILDDILQRKMMNKNGKKIFDGKGLARTVNIIETSLKS